MADPLISGFQIVYISSFCLNSLEIYILVKKPRTTKWYETRDVFLFNLAFLDFTFGFTGVVKTILKAILSDFSTKNQAIFRVLLAFTTFSSVIAIGLLTVDMYIAAVYPFKFRLWRSKGNVCCALLSCWIIIGALQTAYQLQSWHLLVNVNICRRIGVSLSTFITGIFLGYTYWRILKTLRTSRRLLSIDNSKHKSRRIPPQSVEVLNKQKPAEKRLWYIGVFTTGSFLTLTMPYVIVGIVLCVGYTVPIRLRLYTYMIYMAKSPVHSMLFLVTYLHQNFKDRRKVQNRLESKMVKHGLDKHKLAD